MRLVCKMSKIFVERLFTGICAFIINAQLPDEWFKLGESVIYIGAFYFQFVVFHLRWYTFKNIFYQHFLLLSLENFFYINSMPELISELLMKTFVTGLAKTSYLSCNFYSIIRIYILSAVNIWSCVQVPLGLIFYSYFKESFYGEYHMYHSFWYNTHVITSRKLKLNKRGDWWGNNWWN